MVKEKGLPIETAYFSASPIPQQRREIGEKITSRKYCKLCSVPGASSLLLFKCRRANSLHSCNPTLSCQSALKGEGRTTQVRHWQVIFIVMTIM